MHQDGFFFGSQPNCTEGASQARSFDANPCIAQGLQAKRREKKKRTAKRWRCGEGFFFSIFFFLAGERKRVASALLLKLSAGIRKEWGTAGPGDAPSRRPDSQLIEVGRWEWGVGGSRDGQGDRNCGISPVRTLCVARRTSPNQRPLVLAASYLQLGVNAAEGPD